MKVLGGAAAVTVETAETEIFNADVSDIDEVAIDIANLGATALNAFRIFGRSHPSGPWNLLYSAAADFTTPVGDVVFCKLASTGAAHSPVTLAGATRVMLRYRTTGYDGLRLTATVASGTTTKNDGA
ncbi:MAG: hypothetical protein K2W80_02285 [Burkholderiales bacterium]|nr:hypothetical protein [Burkholderiales bacterium]